MMADTQHAICGRTLQPGPGPHTTIALEWSVSTLPAGVIGIHQLPQSAVFLAFGMGL
jgi:hypothetical protein